MRLSKDLNILIVGLGLLGGSYATALRKKGFKVSAITKNEEDIDFALENGGKGPSGGGRSGERASRRGRSEGNGPSGGA